MPVREFADPSIAIVYYTVICDRCLRVGPTRLDRKSAFLDGRFIWDLDLDGASCTTTCQTVRYTPPGDDGSCPECGYAFTRYDRILDKAPYVPGEPCPDCGYRASFLVLGDDTRHVGRIVQDLPEDLDDFMRTFQSQRSERAPTVQEWFIPGTLWRGRRSRLFAVLNQCIGDRVDATIDPHEPNGRRTLRLTKDEFLGMFECVAVPENTEVS